MREYPQSQSGIANWFCRFCGPGYGQTAFCSKCEVLRNRHCDECKALGRCIESSPEPATSLDPRRTSNVLPEPSRVKGYGFSKDEPESSKSLTLPDIEQIRHIAMPPQLRKFAGRQLCKICLSNASATVIDQVNNGIPYREIAEWLTFTDGNGIVYNATNVENHIRHGRRAVV